MGKPITPSPINATFAIVSSCQSARSQHICIVIATARIARQLGVDPVRAARMVAATQRKQRSAMAPTKQQILDSLAKVPAPDGTPLTETDALSDVVVTDGKVFFSIAVDAAAVKAWEPVRERAEKAVRAVPGVTSALVALTAERKAGAAAARPAAGAARRARRMAAAARRPACPASRRSSRSPPARAASANRPPRSISRSAWRRLGSRSASSTPTSTGRRCRSCSPSRSGRRRSAAPGSSRSRATASPSCRSAS